MYISRHIFTLLYSAFAIIAYNTKVIFDIYHLVKPQHWQDYYLIFSILISAFYILWLFYNTILISKLTKFIAILIIFISSISSYFISHYNTLITKMMILNAFDTSVHEVSDLLSIKMLIHLTWSAILPTYIIIKIRLKRENFMDMLKNNLVVFIVLSTLILPNALYNYRKMAAFFRVNSELGGAFTPANIISSTIRAIKSKLRENVKQEPIFDKITVKEKNNVAVFVVVGETARRKNFSLYGYEVETNPLLKKHKISVLKNATSCGTSTNVSVPCMFSHLPKSNLSDNYKYQKLPEALKFHGIYTQWYDNNFGGCYGICDRLDLVNHTSDSEHSSCPNGTCPDGVILDKLDISSLAKRKSLVVLHQNGSHGPKYYQRYPKSFEQFKPVCATNDVQNCSESELVNAYNNSILYTDYFLHTLIEKIRKANIPAVMIYMSDHGESLGENGLFLHGFPYAIAPKEQKEIPFIVYISDEYRRLYPNIRIKHMQSYSHDNLFHTICGLFAVKSELYRVEMDIFAR